MKINWILNGIMDRTLIFKSNMSPISSLRRRSSCYNIQRAEERDRRKSAKFDCAWIFYRWNLLFSRLNCCITSVERVILVFLVRAVLNKWCFIDFSVPEDCRNSVVFVVPMLDWVQARHSSTRRKFSKS